MKIKPINTKPTGPVPVFKQTLNNFKCTPLKPVVPENLGKKLDLFK